MVQAIAIATNTVVSRLGEFYGLAAVFGMAYGGVMPLYAVLAREYFGQRVMGTVFGAATMTSSLGMALGPIAGGWVFDSFGAYHWMFIGSFLVGLGAVAIALAFPPLPSRQQELKPA
jgi:MFS family permease